MSSRTLLATSLILGSLAWWSRVPSDAQEKPAALRTKVAVLGVIHRSHLRSKRYSVQTVIDTVRRFRPDVVFVEIPPHLFADVVARVDKKGFATRTDDLEGLAWIGAFPELYRGVLPLRRELGYEVVPVSGWKPEVSADRRAFWRGPGRSVENKKLRAIYDRVARELRAVRDREGGIESSRFYNSQHYADLRRLERTLWAACFDEGLGRGGEVAINRAHYANIAKALDARRRRGQRVLIVYGAAHRYWFLNELAKRDDVELASLEGALPR